VRSKILAISLILVGLLATAAGLGLRLLVTEDEGHHDGRAPTFALDSTLGTDELVVTPVGAEPEIVVSIERAGQPVTDWDSVHGAPMHVLAVRDDLRWFTHVDPEMLPDGLSAPVALNPGGQYRVVTQSAPGGGADLLELGTDIALAGELVASDQMISTDDFWTEGDLEIRREGLDFVLSEPWGGEDYHDEAALLTMFRAGDLAFAQGHAITPDPDRFRFNLEIPGRGEYLAALQFYRGDASGVLITALFRFEL